MPDNIILEQEADGEIEVTQIPVNSIDLTEENPAGTIDLTSPDPGTIEIEEDPEDSGDGTAIEVTREPRSVLSYNRLSDKPSINGVVLQDDKSFEELGVEPMTNIEILDTFNRVFGGN